MVDDIDKEIDIMLEVSHPYCVELYEVFDSPREAATHTHRPHVPTR